MDNKVKVIIAVVLFAVAAGIIVMQMSGGSGPSQPSASEVNASPTEVNADGESVQLRDPDAVR